MNLGDLPDPGPARPPGPSGPGRAAHAALSPETEVEELRRRLEEAEETIRAIRNGEVDALVVRPLGGDEQIYTLQGAETPYRHFVQQMREGALTLTEDGTVLYSNQRFAEIVGQPLERVSGRTLTELGFDAPTVAELLARAPEGSFRRELTIPRPGGPVTVLLTASRLAPDSVGRICAVLTDLTEQKLTERLMRTQAALRDSEAEARAHVAELQTIYASAPVGMCVLDTELRFVRINERLAEMNGVPAAEHIGRTVWEVVPDVARDAGPLFQHVLETGQPLMDLEIAGRTSSQPGVSRWWRESYYPIRAADGQVAGINVVVQEITDFKRNSEVVQRSAQRFALLSDVAGELLRSEHPQQLVTDLCERVLAFLDCDLFLNYLRDEQSDRLHLNVSAGIPDDQLAPLEWLDYGQGVSGEVARSGRRIVLEDVQQRQDRATEKLRNLGVRAYACHPLMSGGQLTGTLSFGSRRRDAFSPEDISLIKTVSDHIAIAMQRIQSAQVLRESERAERAARQQAEQANRLKDEFLATLSHELRTPLTAVLGWTQLLRRGRLDHQESAEALEIIEQNARAQARLVDELLDMSRIISGKIRLEMRRVDVREVIERVLAAVQPIAEARRVSIDTALAGEAGAVLADGQRLQQVVWNLLSNAVKFTPSGGAVHVLLDRHDGQVRITVSDTGMGIRPEFLPHVFERFRQADASTTRRHGGLGLGLSIVRQLVELHGGSVSVESAGENRGATFQVCLPAAPELADEHVAPGGGSDGVSDVPTRLLHGMTVLVVDDDPHARLLLRRMLEEGGAATAVAGSAGEALEWLRENRADLMISDVGMPERDGYDLLRDVRALRPEHGRDIPAIAVTAFAREEDAARARQVGYQAHVAKPVEAATLISLAASIASRASG